MEIIIISSALLISAFLNILFQKEFIKRGILDKINSRSSHQSLATRSGGSSIFSSLFIISIFFYLNNNEIYDFSLLIPVSIMLVVGLYDDIYKLDFKLKFIFQIIVAKIIIDNGLIIDNLHGIFGVSDMFFLTLLILGSVTPLYYFNFRKTNKVFLGDSGSLFLGAVVSIYVLKILSQDYSIKPYYDLNKVIFVISILSYPILDIIRIFFLRLYKKRSPFLPDKQHIHHIILGKTKKHYLTTCVVVISSLILTIITQIIFK